MWQAIESGNSGVYMGYMSSWLPQQSQKVWVSKVASYHKTRRTCQVACIVVVFSRGMILKKIVIRAIGYCNLSEGVGRNRASLHIALR